jgi:hypothetical protein
MSRLRKLTKIFNLLIHLLQKNHSKKRLCSNCRHYIPIDKDPADSDNLPGFGCAIGQDLFIYFLNIGLLDEFEKVNNWEEFLAKNCEEFETKWTS